MTNLVGPGRGWLTGSLADFRPKGVMTFVPTGAGAPLASFGYG
jgi:hypothetical protein